MTTIFVTYPSVYNRRNWNLWHYLNSFQIKISKKFGEGNSWTILNIHQNIQKHLLKRTIWLEADIFKGWIRPTNSLAARKFLCSANHLKRPSPAARNKPCPFLIMANFLFLLYYEPRGRSTGMMLPFICTLD